MTFSPSVAKFSLPHDVSNKPANGRPAPLHIQTKNLTGGSATTLTVPAGANLITIAGTTAIFANPNGAAAYADATDGTGSMLIPIGETVTWQVTSGQMTIGFKSATDGIVTMAAYVTDK